MGELAHIGDSRSAIRTILKELDWAYGVQMVLVDLIGDIQADPGKRINYPNLRKAAGTRLRQSIERRDAAIAVLDRSGV